MKTETLPIKSHYLRKWSLAILLTVILSAISYLFWAQEVKYELPTPVPQHYKDVKPGKQLSLSLPFATTPLKPLFLHFFNPDCPCSKFNTKHFKELVKNYGHDVQFAVVAMTAKEKYTAGDIQQKFDLDIPITFDTALAAICGVYSTPQAVIINNQKLYFRGNYNKSRYCTNPKTNYAQMALDSLFQHNNGLQLDPIAFKAYGCELPTCNK